MERGCCVSCQKPSDKQRESLAAANRFEFEGAQASPSFGFCVMDPRVNCWGENRIAAVWWHYNLIIPLSVWDSIQFKANTSPPPGRPPPPTIRGTVPTRPNGWTSIIESHWMSPRSQGPSAINYLSIQTNTRMKGVCTRFSIKTCIWFWLANLFGSLLEYSLLKLVTCFILPKNPGYWNRGKRIVRSLSRGSLL